MFKIWIDNTANGAYFFGTSDSLEGAISKAVEYAADKAYFDCRQVAWAVTDEHNYTIEEGVENPEEQVCLE